ncbi:hypothetical protein CsSME_00014942 [Camellia sinensis var. sinensis]
MAPSTIRKAIGAVKDQTSIGIAKVAGNLAPDLEMAIVIHRLLSDGEPVFQQEITYATRRGTRLLNMSDFRDEAHSNSWDHSAFVRSYALYLDQKLELILYERKQSGGASGSGSGGSEIERYGSREIECRPVEPRKSTGWVTNQFVEEGERELEILGLSGGRPRRGCRPPVKRNH